MSRRDPSRRTLAAFGVLAVVVLLGGTVLAFAYSADAFADDPEVTATVPTTAGPIRARSPVQYRGVVVGTVTSVAASPTGATVTMRLSPEALPAVPGNVKVRLLPRTLFGDVYVDLAPPGAPGGRLAAGAALRHDDTAETAQLYQAASRLYELLGAVRPAKLNAALSAVAQALDGRGAELGETIDTAHEALTDAGPMLDTLGADLGTVADLSADLAAAAPDLFGALDNAAALSRTVVQKKDSIAALLQAGIQGTALIETMLLDNRDRMIQLIHDTGPILDTMAAHPGAMTDLVRAGKAFADAGTKVFGHGPYIKMRAPIVLTDLYPYTAADCPRYPGLAGPNCGAPAPAPPVTFGGPVGPVGTDTERQAIAEVLSANPETVDGQLEQLATLLIGPLLRGTQVVLPQ